MVGDGSIVGCNVGERERQVFGRCLVQQGQVCGLLQRLACLVAAHARTLICSANGIPD